MSKQGALNHNIGLTVNRVHIPFLLLHFLLLSCTSNEKYKKDLLSDDKAKIDVACYKLGELRDLSAIKPLFTKILDPRMSNDLRFKGM